MAAKHFYRQGFLLLLFNFISTAALEKRFSDLKRCADEECSMLLCRGKAMQDFAAPDCRFLTVKKSETIYVYYKLAGRRADMWAGSVGSNFGYFPKDLLAVNHIYTEKEFEIPAEETDFVCFDTGYDRFDNYDIDLLLGSSLAASETENNGTSDQIQVADGTQEERQPTANGADDSENEMERHDNIEDIDEDINDQSASLPEPGAATETLSTQEEEPETETVPDATEGAKEDTEVERKHKTESAFENVVSENSETKDTSPKAEVESVAKDDRVSDAAPVSISEGMVIPEVKTTFGTTFDAVTTDEEITKNVTPNEEEESEHVEDPPEEVIDVKEQTPLLSFSEETAETPAPNSMSEHESPPTAHDDKPETTEGKNMWTTLGDAVFSVVTGGETTPRDTSSDEDEDDEDEEEEVAPKVPQSFEETENDAEEALPESPKDPENMEPVGQEAPSSTSVDIDNKDTDGKLLVVGDDDDEDESEGEVIGPEGTWEEPVKPTDEPGHHQTDPEDLVLRDDSSAIPEAQSPDAETVEPADYKEEEQDVSEESEVSDDEEDVLDRSATMEHGDNLDNETYEEPSAEETHSESFDDENAVNDSLPNQIHDRLDLESNTSLSEPAEPEIQEEIVPEEPGEEKEELLEDENALSSVSQSNQTDSDDPPPETTLPDASTPEPEYSDSVLRLTLLRDHFTEESMERIQKLLGLKNLFKVEAMFSDLDTELRATRRSHTGNTQDIENALEGILEASENTILDEIEKMLDSQGAKPGYDLDTDTSNLDEETQILDDFQELAFSLRQKYSTSSDSAPLATEKPLDIDQDEHKLNVVEDRPHVVEEDKVDSIPEAESDDNVTETDQDEMPAVPTEDRILSEEVPGGPDVSVEEDGGHFNKNKDNQPSFSAAEEMQKVPQATLENPLDMGLGVEVEHSSSGSLDPMEPVAEIQEEEEEGVGLISTGIVYMGCILSITKSKITEWTFEGKTLNPD